MDIDFSNMNWFDIAVISVISMSTLLAFFRGFIKAVLSLVTWIVSSFVAVYFYPIVKDYLSGSISNPKLLMSASSVGVFLVVFIIISIINIKILYLLRRIRNGVIDRSLGFAFGLARGALIVCAVFFSISSTSKMLKYGDPEKPGPDFFVEAKTYNILQLVTNEFLSVLPEEWPDILVAEIGKVSDKTLDSLASVANGDGGLPRTLNDDEKKVMAQVIAALPKEDYAAIRRRYEDKVGKLSDIDKMAIFRDILESYDKVLKENKIEPSKKVPEGDVQMLNLVLNGKPLDESDIPEDEGVGYKELNIKQMDRLVDGVE